MLVFTKTASLGDFILLIVLPIGEKKQDHYYSFDDSKLFEGFVGLVNKMNRFKCDKKQ